MTRFFFLVEVFPDVRPDSPYLREGIHPMSSNKPNYRPMHIYAFIRVQRLAYSIWGNAWRMPKSFRDNYRAIKPVHTHAEAARMPQGERKQ